MTAKTLVAPLVHLNGTSQDVLEEQLDAATWAIKDAQDALQNCYPHERDYYPLKPINGKSAYSVAVEQHLKRQEILDSIVRELNDIYYAVCAGNPAKAQYHSPRANRQHHHHQENTND